MLVRVAQFPDKFKAYANAADFTGGKNVPRAQARFVGVAVPLMNDPIDSRFQNYFPRLV